MDAYRLLPAIPKRVENRFRERLQATGRASLLVGCALLAVCMYAEASTQTDVGRRVFFWLPLSIATAHLLLFVVVYRDWFRPKRSVGWLQLISGASPFGISLMSLQKTSGEQMAVFMALELLAIAVLIPFQRICFIGCGIIATTMFCILYGDHTNDLAEVATLLVPPVGLAVLAFMGRQRAIRIAFLREVETEEALYELRLSKFAIDNSSHYVVRFDKAGVVEYANESLCSALSYPSAELVGRRIFEISPDHTADQWNTFVSNLERKRSDRREIRLRTKLGEDILVEVQFDFIEFDFGSPSQSVICGSGFDLTERRRMEEEILRVEKLDGLGTLAGGIAHDYNNLLVPIVTNAQIMLRRIDDADPSRSNLHGILAASERAANLTQQLLVYTGVVNVEAEPICLSHELTSITELMRTSLPPGTKLTLRPPKDVPLIRGESTQIQRVLLNLVVNAGQAIAKHPGEVEIRIEVVELTESEASLLDPPMRRDSGKYVACSVSDTGVGMTPEVCRRMFDPFFTSKPDGRGLGLSAVLGIMRNHNGGIRVDSTLGVGTKIEILLPVMDSLFGPPSKDEPIERNGRVVVVADHEEVVRTNIQKVLTSNGHTVLMAADGYQAIEVCTKNAALIDVLIFDKRMPGPGLDKFVEAVKQLDAGICIIASSRNSDELPSQILEGTGNLELLVKPFRNEELLAAVAAWNDIYA